MQPFFSLLLLVYRLGMRNKAQSRGTSSGSSKLTHMDIAASTLDKIERGSYSIEGRTFELTSGIEEMKSGTLFFPADSDLAEWRTCQEASEGERAAVRITVTECSTLCGARALDREVNGGGDGARERIGVLSFASAKNPGGGFMTGAQAQEESIARSSTLYPSLMTDTAQNFYRSHRKNPHEGYYSHAMVYSPRVWLVRSDDGAWEEPVEVEVVTSCAVNAGVVRRYLRQAGTSDEGELDAAMAERMGRVLCLFERQGVRNVVLGSFGTGVFRNRVELVAGIWKDLLAGRFRSSFDRVEFSVLGTSTYTTFRECIST